MMSLPRTPLLLVAVLSACNSGSGASGARTSAEPSGETSSARTTPGSAVGSTSAAASHRACNAIETRNLCVEFGADSDVKGMCAGEMYEGKLAQECPKEGRLGSCTATAMVTHFYAKGQREMTKDEAKLACGANGWAD